LDQLHGYTTLIFCAATWHDRALLPLLRYLVSDRRYPWAMSAQSPAALRIQAALTRQASRVAEVLARYGATNPRMFGSVARGEARDDSDLDLLVDLVPGFGNELLRVAGIAEELSELLGSRVDVVAATLLRDEVSMTALADAVAV
jgi:uncharacterized protein